MQIELVEATAELRPVLESLFALYQYDFTEFTGEDVSDDGRFGLAGSRGEASPTESGHRYQRIRVGRGVKSPGRLRCSASRGAYSDSGAAK